MEALLLTISSLGIQQAYRQGEFSLQSIKYSKFCPTHRCFGGDRLAKGKAPYVAEMENVVQDHTSGIHSLVYPSHNTSHHSLAVPRQ